MIANAENLVRRGCLLVAICVPWLSGCGRVDADPVVGSNTIEALTTDSMFVERVRIALPFRTIVHNGEPRKLVIRGEDNLISLIDVSETEVGRWSIDAPYDLQFEQHQDIDLEIPYIDMVSITVDRDTVTFADEPGKVWTAGEEGT